MRGCQVSEDAESSTEELTEELTEVEKEAIRQKFFQEYWDSRLVKRKTQFLNVLLIGVMFVAILYVLVHFGNK